MSHDIKALKWPKVQIQKENDVLKLLREVFYMIDHLKEKVCVPTTFVQLNDKSWGNLANCTIKTTTLALEYKVS